MSTFLVSFGVVAAATIGVIVIALGDPEQPPTLRAPTSRGRKSRSPETRPTPGRRPTRPRRSQARSRRAGAWIRVRSGLALMILVAFVGVIMAIMVGTSLALAARALRHAVG